jgi:cytoskeletal protein CcmA (bactofilin family)
MAPSIIGEDLTVTGNVLSKGEVQVDGQIQGDVHCSSLIVGEKAEITGGIVASDVVVRGQVMGSIRGERVTLQSSSHVEGDIFHMSLAIEQGAFFEGKSRRAEDPIASAPKIDLLQGQAAE